MKTGLTLAALLSFSILTLWVGERWALSCVEIGVYLVAGGVIVARGGRISGRITLLAPALMCVWAAIQYAAHWSAVPSATRDAWLYWLAATCFALIGSLAKPAAFLKIALAAGTLVCIEGTVQLYTSAGKVFWLFPSGFDRRVIGPFVSPNNYAAFVELLLPLALVRRTWPYLAVAAILAATVVASGSRAGMLLVLAESVVVMLLGRWNRRAVLAFVLFTGILALVVGPRFLTGRFFQKADLFSVRREFLSSSLAMFRSEPLRGFGLGNWSYVYPRFALIDTGATANHAHNEWAQWAAEGGLPAFALMFAWLILTTRPALRSIWGIGVLAVFAHSLVDYPFLRLGLAAWIFAFLGVLSTGGRALRNLPVAAVIPVLALGSWEAAKTGYADVLYRRATASSVQRAVEFSPDRAEYHLTLAQLDASQAAVQLQLALAANPYDTNARIGLALEREAGGDLHAAERLLQQSAFYDRQFAPAWALAGFYLRRGYTKAFWRWASTAAAISYGDRRAFFDLCYSACGNSHEVFTKLLIPYPALETPFLTYLLDHHRIRDAAEVAEKMAGELEGANRDAVLNYIDAAIDSGEVGAAWRSQKRLGTSGLVVNGDFARAPTNRGFDWRIAPHEDVVVAATRDGEPALSIEFMGREPESCELLTHVLALEGKQDYMLQFDYRTVSLPPQSGISWRFGTEPELELPAAPEWTHREWRIRGRSGNLILKYQRVSGNARASGQLFLRNVQIDTAPL